MAFTRTARRRTLYYAMAMTDVDFGRRSDDYAKYRPGFPSSFYDRLERIIHLTGVGALDLGTGSGVVALELAQRGAAVTGIDLSPNQIDTARRVASERGLEDRARFLFSSAEKIDLPDDSFDLVTAGQCWVWFDRRAVLREVMRLLRPGGLLVVAHYCYLSGRSRIAHMTEQLILKHNPAWTMAGSDGLYPKQIDELQHGGRNRCASRAPSSAPAKRSLMPTSPAANAAVNSPPGPPSKAHRWSLAPHW